MSNAVQLGFPDAVARVLRDKPRGYTKPQYIDYNSQYGNNILYGRSENSGFHDRAREQMLAQLEAKKRDALAREKRFLMGNPMPKLPMHSWTSAGSPFMMADKTVPMSDSGLRGGTQPNYTPEAVAIQRKFLKRRANEAGVLSRNELPPPTLKPKKTFPEALKDVIDTVLISMGDAITSGNYDRVAFEGVYKLIRTFSENGEVFQQRDLMDFLKSVDPLLEALREVITEKVENPNENVGLAKGLYSSMTRVRNVLLKLLKNVDRPQNERKLAIRSLIGDLKKEKAPEILEKVYADMMDQVMAEVESDRETVVPRSFAELGELPMDVYREEDESTFDPYAMEFAEQMPRIPMPRAEEDVESRSPSERVRDDLSYRRFAEEQSRLAQEEEGVAEAIAEAPPMIQPPSTASTAPSTATTLSMIGPDGDRIEAIRWNGMLIPASSIIFNMNYGDSLANLRAFANSIGYNFSAYTDRPNLKRGIISKIRKSIPNW